MSALVHATCGTVDAVTPKDPHVSGWVPNFLPAGSQFERQADRLRSLVGDQVADAELFGTLSMMTGSLTSPS